MIDNVLSHILTQFLNQNGVRCDTSPETALERRKASDIKIDVPLLMQGSCNLEVLIANGGQFSFKAKTEF